MNTLGDVMKSAGYKASVMKEKERAMSQCECGAILNKYGLCRLCDEDLIKPKTHILRRRELTS